MENDREQNVVGIVYVPGIQPTDAKVLVGKREDGDHHLSGKWVFPASSVFPREAPKDAVMRAIKMKTGIDAVTDRLIEKQLKRHKNEPDTEYLWFLCSPLNPDQNPVPGRKFSEAAYIPLKDIESYLGFERLMRTPVKVNHSIGLRLSKASRSVYLSSCPHQDRSPRR